MRVVARAHAAQQREAVGRPGRDGAARQAEVEQDEVEALARERAVGRRRIAHPVDGVALEPERALQGLADHAVVFDEEESHGRTRIARACLPSRAARDNGAMHHGWRVTLLSLRDLFLTAAPFLLLAAALLAVAYWLLDPTPPKRVVLATGQDQGAYAEFGKRYAQILKENGIEVQLRKTAGAAENIALLKEPGGDVDIAFVQGGADEASPTATTDEGDLPDDGLVSLGSLFYEPVWLFYRTDSAQRLRKEGGADEPDAAARLARQHRRARQRRAQPDDASCSRPITSTRRRSRSCAKAQTPAVVGLLDGSIDALVFASAPESLLVQMLLQTPGIALFDFAQSEAYTRRFPFLSAVTLPRGVVDLARDIPPADVRLVAPTATLVARKKTHPALIQLFVQAAQQVHGERGLVPEEGRLPERRATPSGRSRARRSASTPPARRCCSATCRSGSPT